MSSSSSSTSEVKQDPLLKCADLIFDLTYVNENEKLAIRDELLALCREHQLLGVYASLSASHPTLFPLEPEKSQLESKRTEKLVALLTVAEDAKENFGAVELTEAQIALRTYAARTGTKDEALAFADPVVLGRPVPIVTPPPAAPTTPKAGAATAANAPAKRKPAVFEEQSLSTGKRIDILMERARIAQSWPGSEQATRSLLASAEKLLESGGDWDHRNRLKVYQGILAVATRDIPKASTELLSAVATFTAEELFDYETLVAYTVLSSIVALDRVEMKSKLIDSPEIAGVFVNIQEKRTKGNTLSKSEKFADVVGRLLYSLYDCRYRDVMIALADAYDVIGTYRYLAPHSSWFVREIRCKAYSQYLASFSSVKLESMANAFGVSVLFIDNELARFIASTRIAAKIDKVSGIVITTRPDQVNARFQQVIKQGDALLNKIQKLARGVNV